MARFTQDDLSCWHWAAQKLVEVERPDFTSFDQRVVIAAFNKAFNGSILNPYWVNAFSALVSLYSNGAVFIKLVEPNQHFSMIWGVPVGHFELVTIDATIGFTVAPLAAPITFHYLR